MRRTVRRTRASLGATAWMVSLVTTAQAQDIGEGGESGGSAASAPSITATDSAGNPITIQGSITPPTQTTTTAYPYGLPQPGFNPDAHLPSGSRSLTDINTPVDGFDLNQRGSQGPAVVHGDPNAPAILGQRKTGGVVPSMHAVRKGDTLWDLCATYYNNPWMWPKVWSYNPQIQNPHWIYPGDQLRLRAGATASSMESVNIGPSGVRTMGADGAGGGGLTNRRPVVPRQTVFLRTAGYLGDPKDEVWGELVGAREEQMLLADGNHAYMMMREGAEPQLGQTLTVFNAVRAPKVPKGARAPKGQIVAFKGTVRVDQFDPETRIARGEIIESLDVIERGAKVGPVGRRFDVVAPKRNEQDLWARVLTSFYPHEIMGQHQVFFIDRGSEDGLQPGNRLFVVDRGDRWRETLETTTKMARGRVRTDVPERVKVEYTPLKGEQKDFPEEVVAEVRVVQTEKDASLVMVTSATREIEPGDRLVARKGY